MNRFGDYVDANPTVKLTKNYEYPNIDIDKIKVGNKHVDSDELVIYSGQSSSKFEKGDILFARITPCLENGKYAIAKIADKGFGSTEFFVFRGIVNKSLTEYIYYFLGQKWIRQLAANSMTGASGRQRADLKFIKKIKCTIPNLEYQKKVVSLLSKYDQLIENNNKRIKLLEQASQELFREWFVRFRFPGYEKVEKKRSELGMIPTNFEVIKINELIDYYVGGGWGNDDYSEDYSIAAFVIRGADFPAIVKSDVSTCPYRYHKISNYKPRKLKENDIVFEISGGTAEQPVGRAVLVTKGILDQLDDKVICASFCKLIRPKYDRVKPHYFYQWLKFLYDTRMIERFQLQSTGIINFKFEYFLRKGSVLVPSTDLVNKYEKLVAPMRDEIDKLSVGNSYLKKQRDLLLPRLMSGKLEVK